MRIRLLTAVAFFVFVGAQARADMVLEPYAGYGFGSVDAHLKASPLMPLGQDAGAKNTLLDTGLRLGYRFPPGLWIAIDPEFGLAGNSTQNSNGSASAFTSTQIFADLGVDFSIFRFYLGYGLLNQQSSGDSKASGGAAYKAGLDISLTSNIALNLQYRTFTFQTLTDEYGNNLTVSDYYDKLQASEYTVGISVPIGMLDGSRR